MQTLFPPDGVAVLICEIVSPALAEFRIVMPGSNPSELRPLYEAAVARHQVDQIFNLSLTRTATKYEGFDEDLLAGSLGTPVG